MFIGSCNGLFRALELKTGRVRWETKVSPDAVQYFFHGDPLVAGDVIVAGADRATGASVHAFDRLTGKELWSHPAGRGVNGPLAGTTTHAYAFTVEGQLLSLAIDSGRVRWQMPLKGPGFEGPAVAGRVVAGTVDGIVYGLNPLTGREEWRRDLKTAVTTTPLASDGAVYIGAADSSLYRLDISQWDRARIAQVGCALETEQRSVGNRGRSSSSVDRSGGRLPVPHCGRPRIESCSVAGCRRHQLEHESSVRVGRCRRPWNFVGRRPHLLQGHRYARLEPIRQGRRSLDWRSRGHPVSWNPNWGALRVECAPYMQWDVMGRRDRHQGTRPINSP